MLTISCPPLLIPFRAVKSGEINVELLQNRNKCRIGETGIYPAVIWRNPVSRAFRVGEFKFGWRDPDEYSNEGVGFIEGLRMAGASIEYINERTPRGARFWFDVSPKGARAYYCLYLKSYGNQIVLMPELYMSDLCDAMDDEVLRNVQILDSALYLILAQCGLIS